MDSGREEAGLHNAAGPAHSAASPQAVAVPASMWRARHARVCRTCVMHACRYQAGAPRSILEGVPYAVKDVADALPYPTTAGTSFLGAE